MGVTGDVVKHAQNWQCCTVQSVILSRPHGISMISERPNIKTKGIQEDGGTGDVINHAFGSLPDWQFPRVPYSFSIVAVALWLWLCACGSVVSGRVDNHAFGDLGGLRTRG